MQTESLGPAFEFMPGYETFWTYIPHFIHSPFYVYAYAFGDGLVNALYAVYEEGDPGFQDKYFAMLEAGGSKHHKELLAPFGLDASDPTFWEQGPRAHRRMIDELEAMEAEAASRPALRATRARRVRQGIATARRAGPRDARLGPSPCNPRTIGLSPDRAQNLPPNLHQVEDAPRVNAKSSILGFDDNVRRSK